MEYILENSFLELRFRNDEISWDLRTFKAGDPVISGAFLSASYRSSRKLVREILQPPVIDQRELVITTPAHGRTKQLQVAFRSNRADVRYQVIFALPEDAPYLLIKFFISNQSKSPIYLDRIGFINIRHQSGGRYQSLIQNLYEPIFFSNGWGSWDYAGAYGPSDHFRRSMLGPFTLPMRKNPGTPHPSKRGHFSSDMFAVLGCKQNQKGIVFGFLSQKEHFGTIETWLKPSPPEVKMWANGDNARLDPEADMATDWAVVNFVSLDELEPLAPYAHAVAREHNIEKPPALNAHSKIPVGWCSWYEFFHNVSAQDIQNNTQIVAEHSDQLPLDIIQVDDGYQTLVGDWLSVKPTFSDGMKSISDEVKSAGLTPGLWIAPFIVHPKSKLAQEHPEWITRGKLNYPVNAGFSSWGAFTTGLDLTHPDALKYVRDVIHNAVHNWGYTYLKLDFLYAGALKGRRNDSTRTLAQVLRSGLEVIREAAGDETFIVGCGCPIGSGLGLVDSMRIGPDVDPNWMPNIFGLGRLIRNEPGLPSTRNSIHNILSRAFMGNCWWINDPDCLLLREDMSLTIDEIRALTTAIALSGGSLMLSDNLPSLSPERLEIAQALLPVIGKRPYVPDLFETPQPARVRLDLENGSGKWTLIAHFNWMDEATDVNLSLKDYRLDPVKAYIGREYWSGEIYKITEGCLQVKNVPPHGVILLSLRHIVPDEPLYIGSNLHISQGLEISAWLPGQNELIVTIDRKELHNREVFLMLPAQYDSIQVNDNHYDLDELHIKNCYSVRLMD